jgi:hypothetical protein
MSKRGIGGNTGAKQWRGGCEVELVRNVEHEILIDHDRLGISPVGRGLMVLFEPVIRLGIPVQAVLFQVPFAILANPAGVDQAAGASEVAHFESGHLVPYFDHLTHDFVAGDHGKNPREPFVPDLVKVRMAYSAKLDIELYVMGSHLPALEVPGGEIGFGGLGGEAFYGDHFIRF